MTLLTCVGICHINYMFSDTNYSVMVIMMNWPGRSDKRHISEPFLLSLDALYTQTLLIWISRYASFCMKQKIQQVQQELLILSEHLCLPPVFSGVRVAPSIVLWVVFCWSLYFLSFFNLQLLIIPLVSCHPCHVEAPILNVFLWVCMLFDLSIHDFNIVSLVMCFLFTMWYFLIFFLYNLNIEYSSLRYKVILADFGYRCFGPLDLLFPKTFK